MWSVHRSDPRPTLILIIRFVLTVSAKNTFPAASTAIPVGPYTAWEWVVYEVLKKAPTL